MLPIPALDEWNIDTQIYQHDAGPSPEVGGGWVSALES